MKEISFGRCEYCGKFMKTNVDSKRGFIAIREGDIKISGLVGSIYKVTEKLSGYYCNIDCLCGRVDKLLNK